MCANDNSSVDTIFALATSLQPAPVALVRVSGAACVRMAGELLGVDFRADAVDALISTRLGRTPCRAWFMPAPRTLTGEPTIEIRVPGNPRLVAAVEARLSDLGARRAEPGEFTRRALEAGKLDLSRAEAVAALINSQSEAERRQALADLSGASARELAALTERFRVLSAGYEVAFDFSEDEPEAAPLERLGAEFAALARELEAFCVRAPHRPLRERPVVALFGPPNAGKSSLFNALLGKRRSLVSELPGTTRDPVRAPFSVAGFECELRDLSGVGADDADAGRFAETARGEALGADVLLLLCAPRQASELKREFEALLARDADLASRVIWVNTMTDRTNAHDPAGSSCALETVSVSALTGSGLDALSAAIAARLAAAAGGAATSLLRVRAAEALRAVQEVKSEAPPEALAGAVRRALTLLDEALLASAPGEVLDLIFSRFCIGK